MSVKEIMELLPSETEGESWLTPTVLSSVLYDEAAYNYMLKAARNGDGTAAWQLIKYCYENKQYDKVLELSPLVKKHDYGYDEVVRMLASMYQNGDGVEQDLDKAAALYKKCLKIRSLSIQEESDYYNLGRIYRIKYGKSGLKSDLIKARKYYKAVISPCLNGRHNEIVKKAKFDYRALYRFCSSDVLRLTVKTDVDGECSFSLKILGNTCLIIDWGEKNNAEEIVPIGTSILNDIEIESEPIKHKYQKRGTYKISISTEGAYFIEGLIYNDDSCLLLRADTSRCPALKKFVATNQMLDKLDFSKNPYLHGLICRGNRLTKIDLTQNPAVTHLDCSHNPLEKLALGEDSALTVLNCNCTKIPCRDIRVLHKNRGRILNQPMSAKELVILKLRLEYYVRCSSWENLLPFLEKEIKEICEPECYDDYSLDELKRAFDALKAFDVEKYHFPYISGYCEVMDSYVTVENLEGDRYYAEEEWFIRKAPWTVCMATPLVYGYYREPWMRFKPIQPEYFVACCLLNMITNDSEKEKYINK